jgi:hypothetical protein
MAVHHIVRRLVTVALLASALFGTVACGFVLTQGPPEGHQQMTHFTCTESNVGPILDVVEAGGGVLIAVVGSSSSNTGGGGYGAPSGSAAVATGLLGSVVWGVSAAVGLHKTSECRAAMRQLGARLAQGRPSLMTGQPVAPNAKVVAVSPPADTMAVGERVQLVAAAYDSSGAVIPHKLFVWSSSNDAIASVGADGLVSAHASGSVVIAARTDYVVGTASVFVVPSR